MHFKKLCVLGRQIQRNKMKRETLGGDLMGEYPSFISLQLSKIQTVKCSYCQSELPWSARDSNGRCPECGANEIKTFVENFI